MWRQALAMRAIVTFGIACVLVASGCSSGNGGDQELQRREQTKAEQQAETTPPPPRTSSPDAGGIWISRAEVRRLPMRGAAWNRVKAAADGPLGKADIADQDSHHDVLTMAVALVYARTGEESYRRKAADAIEGALGTERGGRTLALGRNLLSYVIAADLIDLRSYDPAGEASFREWLAVVRQEPLGSRVPDETLIGTAERSISNWGGMAGASRVAIDAYLRDERDLARAAKVMKGWLGDRSVYPGIPGPLFRPDDTGKGFRAGGYNVALAELLYRQGYDVYEWEDRALLRATRFLYDLERAFPDEGWWEPATPVYWIIKNRYGQSFPVEMGSTIGRNVGWTDWTHAPH